MNPSEILNAAADVLHINGWHQGGYAPDQAEDGIPLAGLPVCAMGAIYTAAQNNVRWSESLGCWSGFEDVANSPAAEAGDILSRHLGSGEGEVYIPRWNDAKGRTVDEVIEALRAAAVVEEAREDAGTNTEAVFA